MRLSRTLALAAGLAVAVVVSTSGSAAAEPLEQEHFHDSGSEVIEGFCGDLTVRVDFEADVYFSVKSHGPDGLIYFAERFRRTDVWTNLANDKTITLVNVGQDKDLRVTDNADGTLTIRFARSGPQFGYAPDGTRLFIDAGTFWTEVLIDHGGTPTDPSDDEFLEFLGVVKQAGRSDTGRDLCAVLQEFIG